MTLLQFDESADIGAKDETGKTPRDYIQENTALAGTAVVQRLTGVSCDDWNTARFFEHVAMTTVSHCLSEGAEVGAQDENEATSPHFAATRLAPGRGNEVRSHQELFIGTKDAPQSRGSGLGTCQRREDTQVNGTLVRLTGGLALMIAVSMPLSEARSETVRIQHYTHTGCEVAGKRYLPAGADSGLAATFRLPEQRQQCLDAVKRMQVGCEMATDFQSTNPDGHPWKPGEKHPRCLSVFAAEIPACIGHYELESRKCHGLGSEIESEERERLALEAEEDMVVFPPNTWMRVLKDANVHAGPSTTAKIVRLIPAGHAVRVSGRIGNWIHFGWLKDGEEQFVYAPLLRETKDPGASK